MCQLSYIHTKDNELNRLLFLLLGSFGSQVHHDGWGIVNNKGDAWKCDLPMGLTWNAGDILKDKVHADYSPLMGHIRLASPQVPVITDNAHPFRSRNNKLLFMHNGTLKPKIEKDFTLTYDVEEESDKGVKTIKKVKISDSLIFFDKFQEIFTEDKSFEDALRETMDLFYGKFALMFYNMDTKIFHIIRGKTADLHITYLLESPEDTSPIIGYAINTSKDLLEMTTTLLSNICQLQTGKQLYFTKVVLLDAETIYEAGDIDLIKVGEIKENYAPATLFASGATFRGQTNTSFWRGDDWGDETEETKKVEKKTSEARYAQVILEFMEDFCLHFKEIQYMLLKGYGISTLESKETIIKQFCEIVIPRYRSLVPKDIRKQMKTLIGIGTFPSIHYTNPDLNLEFPWMINPPETILKLIKYLQTEDSDIK